MFLTIYPFIMCGGAGTRLWPMSTKSHPKQFHKIISNLSMLQETIVRSKKTGSVQVQPPSFICSSAHRDLILEQCEEIGVTPHQIILEPMAKNTAAVAAAVALTMTDTGENSLVLLLPADQYIEDVPSFWTHIQSGCASAKDGNIVTFGIHPTHPETGYGYIQSGEQSCDQSRDIIKFVEKPDLATAKSYLENGNYFWNAGIFLFHPDVMLATFEKHARDILATVTLAVGEAKTINNQIYLDPVHFDQCRSESFDYAIMEIADNIRLIGPVDIGWNDIGSWRAVWEHESRTSDTLTKTGYCGDSNSCRINSKDVLIRSSGPFVATVGVSNIAVVATEQSVLVIDLDASQDVKKVVSELKAIDAKGLF